MLIKVITKRLRIANLHRIILLIIVDWGNKNGPVACSRVEMLGSPSMQATHNFLDHWKDSHLRVLSFKQAGLSFKKPWGYFCSKTTFFLTL